MRTLSSALLAGVGIPAVLSVQAPPPNPPPEALPKVLYVEPQPVLAQAVRLEEALRYLGSSLAAADIERLEALQHEGLGPETSRAVQAILDPYCLAMVSINPEARVKVVRGPAPARLLQGGWRSFLVKVQNQAGVTARLEAVSPNAEPLLHAPSWTPHASPENALTPGQVDNRFLELALYRNRPLQARLSGLELEYVVLQIYSNAVGKREAELGFHIGQGTQDVGFRDSLAVLFEIVPSVRVTFDVKDEDGSPAMASFIIADGVERIVDDSEGRPFPRDYRLAMARTRHWEEPGIDEWDEFARARWGSGPEGFDNDRVARAKRLRGLYPLPSRRVATRDEYPDFFFQPQVYRADGEHVMLPPGTYEVTFTRGPEYVTQTKRFTIPPAVDSLTLEVQLERWVHLAAHGWYSADHHVHAAGCSHYESPEEGVRPDDMWRQQQGEDLTFASALSWGPCWYYQKKFFTGNIHPLSTDRNILRYDVEVSGFPSSHAGHVALLGLEEDDYPGASTIEEWPSWTLPILQWARAQGAAVGYAHSGLGLQPLEPTNDLPNYVMPALDGIGANEYVVAVAHGAVDFFSAGNTPAPWELNMWYQTLNAGFRPRLSGETDFPCIFDERVGQARTYVKLEGGPDFGAYLQAVRQGRSYVSDGRSHIIDFVVNERELGMDGSELSLGGPKTVAISARVAAYLPETPDEVGQIIASRKLTEAPYWHIERARIAEGRRVSVELIVNGESVQSREIEADGEWKSVRFQQPISRSSWTALRIYPSVHTNPIFVLVDGKPIRASRRSAEWCRLAVDRCWEMKNPQIREQERAAAAAAYDEARRVYDRIIEESAHDPDDE